MEQTMDNPTPVEVPQTPEGQAVETPQEQTQTVAPVADDTATQVRELQKKLNDLANENAALSQRFNEIGYQQPPQAQPQSQLNEDYVIAMQKAAEGESEEAAKYLERARQREAQMVMQQVSRVVDTNYLLRQKEQEILTQKPYLRPVQQQMEQRFSQLVQQYGMPYEKAMEQAVKEFDTSFQIAAQQYKPQVQPTPPPAGSQGVVKQQPQIPVPAEKPHMTNEEWFHSRKNESASKYI